MIINLAFEKKHSTLIEVVDKIQKELEEGKFITGIYIDLNKAFNTVDHELLLHKLNYYGIRGTELNRLKIIYMIDNNSL